MILRPLFFYGFIFIFLLNAKPQSTGDTIIVQTLEFSDITKRRGWYIFPSDTTQYHKILMYYTLKCDAATTQDNYHCGEWDYTTYTRLYDHQNINSPYYYYKNTNPELITYNDNPKYDINQSYFSNIVYDSIINEASYTIGAGNDSVITIFPTQHESGKAQFLITATELQNQGLSAGTIDRLSLEVLNQGEEMKEVEIKIKKTTLPSLNDSTYEKDSLISVYHSNSSVLNLGQHAFNFTNPFIWDGASNIVVDLTFINKGQTNNNYVFSGDDYGTTRGVYQLHNGCLDFEDDDIVDVPSSVFIDVDTAITISFWCYGDEQLMPFNSYIFEGRDTNGYRVVNCHLPWSNSKVYWDAGNSGTSSYDRIYEQATLNDFAGKWNHWAFTKDAASGEMYTFLNGELFTSGTGKNKLMSGIQKFRIGGNASSGFNGAYDGKIDEFRIWNKALDQNTIKSWMSRSIDSTHPNYSNLKAAYDFNENNGVIADDYSNYNHSANLLGLPDWEDKKKHEFNVLTTNSLPKITFYQGSYTSHLDSSMVVDTAYHGPVSIIESNTYIDMNKSGISSDFIDTIYAYEDGWGYTYDKLGLIIDSMDFGTDHQLSNLYEENIHQIQNYVTPYGIGLSLGPSGFRWVYDVTDYRPLLNDTIEFSAGNQQELIDVKFIMIKGTPPRDVLDFETIWRGDYSHANIANDVSLPEVKKVLIPNAAQYKIKTRTTGHWFGGFQNCAEFCPKLHHLKINGVKEFEWLNWKECSNNPVVAQGGTWIYDRAGWCPGTFGTTFNHELTGLANPGDSVNIDYGMEVTAGGMEGNYRLTVQLVSYGDNNFQNDAGITDVLAPNNWEYHNKINPMCDQPKIVLTNTGSLDLETAQIEYWICGGPHEFYTWNGQLKFEESTTVELPISGISFWDHSQFCKTFHVSITSVNGVADEYTYNNHYKTEFESPPVYPNDLILWFRSNNAGNENQLYVKDINDSIIFSRTSFTNNTLYKDTIHLTTGCYKVELIDTDEDGLYFFANNDGTGIFSIRKVSGAPLKGFESDFGDKLEHYFSVGYGVNINETFKEVNFKLYPNPVNELINLELNGFVDKVEVEIFDALGKLVIKDSFINQEHITTKKISFIDRNKGMYYIKISDPYHVKTKTFVH